MTGFPWYDSPWLATYAQAKAWIAHTHRGPEDRDNVICRKG